MKKAYSQLSWQGNHDAGIYFSILLSMLMLLLLSSPLRAQESQGKGQKKAMCPYKASQQGCMQTLAGTLDLTKEQVTRIQAVQDEYLKESKALKADMGKKKAAAADLFRNPEASDKELLAAQKEVAALKEKMRATAMTHRLKARNVLTPDQIRKIPDGCRLGIKSGCAGGGCGKGTACGKGCACGKAKANSKGCPYSKGAEKSSGDGYGKCGRSQ